MIARGLSGRIGRDADACGSTSPWVYRSGAATRTVATRCGGGLSQRFFERSRSQGFERKIEDISVSAEPFECPGEVGLRRDT